MTNTQNTSAIAAGDRVEFIGYAEGFEPEDDIKLVPGEIYQVHEAASIDEETGEQLGVLLLFPNPDFDDTKRVSAKSNPEYLQLEAMEDEIRLVEGEAETKPAKKAAKKTATKTATKTAAKKTATKTAAKKAAAKEEEPEAEAEAEAPAKPVAKAPTAAQKKKAAAAAAAAEAEAEAAAAAAEAAADAADAAQDSRDETDEDLEHEDQSVLELVAQGDLINTALQLESDISRNEWALGGVLHHIQRTKAYLDEEVEGHEGYAENGGFGLFIKEYFNLDYRKAMYLIQIYREFNRAGIENGAEVLSSIGWTKASKIAPKLNEEDAVAEDLIGLAESNTVKDLSALITEGKTTVGGETIAYKTIRFRFIETEAALATDALSLAREQLGLDDDNAALLHILTEWTATQAGDMVEEEVQEERQAPGRKARTKA